MGKVLSSGKWDGVSQGHPQSWAEPPRADRLQPRGLHPAGFGEAGEWGVRFGHPRAQSCCGWRQRGGRKTPRAAEQTARPGDEPGTAPRGRGTSGITSPGTTVALPGPRGAGWQRWVSPTHAPSPLGGQNHPNLAGMGTRMGSGMGSGMVLCPPHLQTHQAQHPEHRLQLYKQRVL